MAYNSNQALDLDIFDPRKTAGTRSRAKAGTGTVETGSKPAAKRTPPRSKTMTPERRKELKQEKERREAGRKLARRLAFGIIAVIAVTVLLKGQVQHLELTREIEEANAELINLEQEYEALKIKFDTKMSDSAVEEYAVSVLGMQKRENSQTDYISLGVDNVFELAGQESDDWYQTNIERILSYTD